MQSLSPNLPPDTQREMLRRMLTIRHFEERASANYLAGKIYGVVHCYIGEEAVAVSVCPGWYDRDEVEARQTFRLPPLPGCRSRIGPEGWCLCEVFRRTCRAPPRPRSISRRISLAAKRS
jgi:hypothetical protein